LALPFIFLRLLWRSRRIPENRKNWLERLGFCPFQLEKSIWVHAVSVGETIAAVPLIKALKKEYPSIPIVVTTMTVTGAARVKAIFGDDVFHVFIPYDLPGAITRFLKYIHPQILIILETELWPNLFATCKRHSVPIVITNARLSEKSMRGYQKISSLTRGMLSAVNALAAQANADAERFMALGMPKNKITITGNIKFDLEVPSDLIKRSAELYSQLQSDPLMQRPVWIAASTHAGEESIILQAHRLVKTKHPTALLILVPRHPNRFIEVAALCEQQGFKIARRSESKSHPQDKEIYLCDTMGELLLMYSVADVAFVGGSLVSVGGHNMLEPAALHKPILTGPVLFNFAEISELLLKANAMFIAKNAEELAEYVNQLFTDPSESKQVGERAYHVVEKNRGALLKQVECINQIICNLYTPTCNETP
jgi:3-deoxy-D-manno-octulosonic-acid transferase